MALAPRYSLRVKSATLASMTKPPHRHKGSYEFWIAERAKEESVAAIDAMVRSRAQKVIDIWNARGALLYYPTFYTALRTGHRWLTFQCPARIVQTRFMCAPTPLRENVDAGGLMSYGPNVPARRAADLVDKILRGSKPADIPVEQPTKFEFVLNLTTAKALELDVPPSLLVRADEIIE
jgi:hypothetical protein